MATKTVSVITGTTNQAPTTAYELNAFATDFLTSGVVGSITLNTGSGGTGSFAVNAQASPAMSVRVSQGTAYVTATPSAGSSQSIRVAMDAFEDVTIAANSTGGARYDWVYIKVDATNLAAPNAAKDNVATLVTSRSTSNTSDNGTPPTYGFLLAIVTVANGASSITNSNITDSRTQASVWPRFSGATAYRSTAQSIANSTFAQIAFDGETYDTDNYHSTSTNTTRLTVPVTGYYRITYNAGFTIAAGGIERTYWVAVNGNGGSSANRYANTSTGVNISNNRGASVDIALNAGDYVELWAYQDSGGALNTISETPSVSTGQMRLSIQRLA